MLGNPFPRPMDLSTVLFLGFTQDLWPFGSGAGEALNCSEGQVYTYDEDVRASTGQRYQVVSANATPGLGNYIEPYQGYWLKLKETTCSDPIMFLPYTKEVM